MLLWENQPLQPSRVNYSFSSNSHNIDVRYVCTPKEDPSNGFLKWKKERKRAIQTQVTVGVFAAHIQQKHSFTSARYYACQFHVCMKHRQQYTYFPFCFYGWQNEDVGKWMRNERQIHTNASCTREREKLFSICMLLALSMKSLSIVRSIAYATHRTESKESKRGNEILMRRRISIQSNWTSTVVYFVRSIQAPTTTPAVGHSWMRFLAWASHVFQCISCFSSSFVAVQFCTA